LPKGNLIKYSIIIYWINKDKNRIDIANVFDTRQNPLKMEKLK